MSRRRFITGVVLAVTPLDAPASAQEYKAQQAAKVWRIGILALQETRSGTRYVPAVVQGLRDFGYIEGQNITIEFRSAEGDERRWPELARDLARLRVDVIMASANNGTLAAMSATSTIPIVMMATTYPVERGIVTSVSRPGGNVTGTAASLSIAPAVKVLEFLREAVPHASRVGVLTVSRDIGSDKPRWHSSALDAARTLGLALVPVPVNAPDQLANVFAQLTQKPVNALFYNAILPRPARRDVIDFALKRRLPLVAVDRNIPEDGGLLSHGADYAVLYRRSAVYVDKILKGARPGDLPVEQATKFELVINLKTAKALGLTIPQSLLLRAQQVIE
jgi:putative ABC transport system substrate-binding protein